MSKNYSSPSEAAWLITLQYLNGRQADLGLTVYQLAKDAGMPESTVHRIMNGQRIPSVVTYFQLLTGLKLNPHLVPKEIDNTPYPDHPAKNVEEN